MKKWKLEYKLPSGTRVTFVSCNKEKVYDAALHILMGGLRGVIKPA